ncbi:MAG TPA: pyridoxamine 5'-phosphate oxidase family protein [Afifellaceae bacterium]|nr:pyridoxamine 5'-phosphate oxidase family protein [Afifellaceae bacterium]
MTGSGFDPVIAATSLWRKARQASLATVSASGMPFNSWVGVAPDCRTGTIVLLLSDLAVHTANLKTDPRASLLIVGRCSDIGEPASRAEADVSSNASDDPLTLPRLTLVGHVALASDPDIASPVYLDRHPGASGYAGFGDFRIYRFAPQSVHLVAGFGRIADIDPAVFADSS